jgi:hypothetical protein
VTDSERESVCVPSRARRGLARTTKRWNLPTPSWPSLPNRAVRGIRGWERRTRKEPPEEAKKQKSKSASTQLALPSPPAATPGPPPAARLAQPVGVTPTVNGRGAEAVSRRSSSAKPALAPPLAARPPARRRLPMSAPGFRNPVCSPCLATRWRAGAADRGRQTAGRRSLGLGGYPDDVVLFLLATARCRRRPGLVQKK